LRRVNGRGGGKERRRKEKGDDFLWLCREGGEKRTRAWMLVKRQTEYVFINVEKKGGGGVKGAGDTGKSERGVMKNCPGSAHWRLWKRRESEGTVEIWKRKAGKKPCSKKGVAGVKGKKEELRDILGSRDRSNGRGSLG